VFKLVALGRVSCGGDADRYRLRRNPPAAERSLVNIACDANDHVSASEIEMARLRPDVPLSLLTGLGFCGSHEVSGQLLVEQLDESASA
jgi:hypothetical protein